MAEHEDPERLPLGNVGAERAGPPARKLPAARRLLVATIGAATLQFVSGCGKSAVANLMAAPEAPESGRGGFGQSGRGGSGGSAGHVVANLMAPPFVPQSGTGGWSGGAGVPGQGGSGGAGGTAGTDPADMDAGIDDDAGQA